MKDIKKLMITLVALLALTTGAWADGIVCTASDLGKVLCTDGSIYENVSAATTAGKEAVAMIAYVDETNKNGLALALTDEDGMTWDNSSPSNKGKTAPEICSALNTSKAVTGGTWKLPSKGEWQQMFSANGGNEESYTGLKTAIGNAGGTALVEGDDYWSSSEVDDWDAWLVNLADGNASWDTYGKHYSRCIRACLAFDIAASSGPEVAWDKAKNTGTFKMPGGNVTLEPEYYPQAELTAAPTAINDVPATTDGAIVKAGTVANIGSTETAQGTVMYYVSPTALDDAALLALAADQWTADVPTAESLTAGQAYVYYYVRGNDSDTDEENFSDGDILATNALTVTIAAEPTYAITLAEGAAHADQWQLKAGEGDFQVLQQPVTGVKSTTKMKLKFTGDKSLLKGVRAKKKASAPATVLSGALVDGAIIKVNFKWRGSNAGDYVQGVYNAASGTFTVSKGGDSWGIDDRAVYKVEKSGDNIIIGASFYDYSNEAMVWTFNTTNDTYTTTNGTRVNEFPTEYGLISVSVNGTDITSQLTAQ